MKVSVTTINCINGKFTPLREVEAETVEDCLITFIGDTNVIVNAEIRRNIKEQMITDKAGDGWVYGAVGMTYIVAPISN